MLLPFEIQRFAVIESSLMVNNKMKIICDVSLLGCCHVTGVPRVTEEVAIGLFRRPECEIIFCSDKNNYSYVKKYLKKVDYFPGYRLSKPETLLPFSFFISCMGYCSERRRELKIMINGGSKHGPILRAYKEFLN